jgi:hypothetical protein
VEKAGSGLGEEAFAHQYGKCHTARVFVQIEQAQSLSDREVQTWHFSELATDAIEQRLVGR